MSAFFLETNILENMGNLKESNIIVSKYKTFSAIKYIYLEWKEVGVTFLENGVQGFWWYGFHS